MFKDLCMIHNPTCNVNEKMNKNIFENEVLLELGLILPNSHVYTYTDLLLINNNYVKSP